MFCVFVCAKDREEGLFSVSCKLSLALSCLQWLGLQSVADIKVVQKSPQGVTTCHLRGDIYVVDIMFIQEMSPWSNSEQTTTFENCIVTSTVRWVGLLRLHRLHAADKECC